MKQLLNASAFTFVVIILSSCNKSDQPEDFTSKGFIVTQIATCYFGTVKITNQNIGDVYIDFDSPTFRPKPNTWYRASNPGGPCGICDGLFRYKTGSDVSPKDVFFSSGADMNVVLSQSNLCN